MIVAEKYALNNRCAPNNEGVLWYVGVFFFLPSRELIRHSHNNSVFMRPLTKSKEFTEN